MSMMQLIQVLNLKCLDHISTCLSLLNILLVYHHGYYKLSLLKCQGSEWLKEESHSMFSFLCKYNPHVVCLQETHLVSDTISHVRKTWVQWSSHSTHSTYSRGVSLLIHKRLRWEVGQVLKDHEVHFVFVHTWIDSRPFVILCLYIPSPGSRFYSSVSWCHCNLYG